MNRSADGSANSKNATSWLLAETRGGRFFGFVFFSAKKRTRKKTNKAKTLKQIQMIDKYTQ